MDLDNLERFQKLDPAGMLAEIESLPQQLRTAWDWGQGKPLPQVGALRQVLVAGMGGSAIGADLLAAYGQPLSRLPIIVWRDYDLPHFVAGPETLVIASSHSGNTEETLSAFESGRARGARLLALTTGGALADMAAEAGAPCWQFEHQGQPRAAVGWSFGLLLAIFDRLGLIEGQAEEIDSAWKAMRRQQEMIGAQSAVSSNPAKRMAGQLMGRWPTIIGADLLAPVARRWRTQLAELPKALAQFETLPEADHNMIAGVVHPEPLFANTMVVFLQAHHNHPRNQRRIEITRSVMMLEGFNTDLIMAVGDSRLAQQWTSLHFGDYTAYYLAMAYGVDPTPVAALDDFKSRL